MRIGILSDTHDQVQRTARAVAMLIAEGAEALIHCGDLTSPEVVYECAGLPSYYVFGNNDFDRMELSRYAQKLGIACYGNFGELELDGKRIAVMHGDDMRLKQRIVTEQRFDYLFLGHSHIRHDQRIGKTRIVNPGALHRTSQAYASV